jgi:hypothetical protein
MAEAASTASRESFGHALIRVIARWTPLAVSIFVLFGTLYVVAQQNLREGANDPQVQLAREVADALASGATPAALLPAGEVDIARSLAPFFMVYRDDGTLEAFTGRLGGQPPELPAGALAYASAHGENRLTWAPRPDARLATVIVRYVGVQSGYVLVSRSLREVETRVDRLGALVAVGLVAALLGTLLFTSLGDLGSRVRR